MKQFTKYVGLDTHKETIAVAIADAAGGKPRYYGEISNTPTALTKLMKDVSPNGEVASYCYEAGPCGYGIYHQISGSGHYCSVVAPSLIPTKAGDRVKTDRRDSENLARLHTVGELTPVWVPDHEQEAIRDLTRGREDMKHLERQARQRLSAFLLRHGRRYTSGKSKWTQAYWRWLESLKFDHRVQQIVFQEYIDSVKMQQQRVGDMTRFDSPSKLMSYLGLVPSESSSGTKTNRGGITKTGNGHVRRVLVEAAWCYRFPARKTAALQRRAEATSDEVQAIAWKAQKRLCGRYRTLNQRGLQVQKTVTAIARELVGFIWAIARETMPRTSVSANA